MKRIRSKFSRRLGVFIVILALLAAVLPLLSMSGKVLAQTEEEIKAEMLAVLENYSLEKIKNFFTGEALDPLNPNVKQDLQYPREREIGVPAGKNWDLTVLTSHPEVIESQTYRGHVYRPMPDAEAVSVTLTGKLTDRESGVSAEKVVGTVTVLPLVTDELKVAKSLMDDAKSNLFDGIKKENTDPRKISTDLRTFQEVQREGADSLKWVYRYADRDFLSIRPVKIDPDNAQLYAEFRSSRPDIVAHFNLKIVEKPEYDTPVTISTVLSHQEFGKYAPKLDDGNTSETAQLLRSLYRQPADVVVTVLGEKGPDPNPGRRIKGSFTVTGSKILEKPEDHANAHEEWLKVDFDVVPGTSLYDLTKFYLDRPEEGREVVLKGDFLTSITIDGKTNTSGETNGKDSYWFWYVNGEVGSVGAGSYYIKDGDVLEWKYINDPKYPSSVKQETADPPHNVGSTPDYWTSFASNSKHNAVKTAEVVTKPDKIAYWGRLFAKQNAWGTASMSDLLVIGDDIYFASDNKLLKVNERGIVIAQTSLRANIGFFARLAYDNGLVLVPLDGGAVQAIDVKTMKTVWVAKSLDLFTVYNDDMTRSDYPIQDSSTILIADGIAYSSTVALNEEWVSVGGYLRAIDMKTGETLWQHERSYKMDEMMGWGGQGAGYYWSGPIKMGNFIVVAGEDGALWSFDAKTGKTEFFNNAWPVMPGGGNRSPKLRSSLVEYNDKVYLTSGDGKLHRMGFNKETGKFTSMMAEKTVEFAIASSSTPTIHDGKIYVGGLKEGGGWPGKGVFAVVNLETFEIEKTFEVAGEVKSTPLVVVGKDNKPFVYFTANNEDGALYVFDGEEVTTAFMPEGSKKNYCTASPVIDSHGTIYYNNDSGHLFALREQVPVYTLSLDDSGEGYQELVETTIKGLVKGELLWDAVVRVKDDKTKAHKEIADRQFENYRVMLLDIELTDPDDAGIPVVSDDAVIAVDFKLDEAFVKDSESVALYRLNQEKKIYEKVDSSVFDASTGVLKVEFDRFSAYAAAAGSNKPDPTTTTTVPSEPTETKSSVTSAETSTTTSTTVTEPVDVSVTLTTSAKPQPPTTGESQAIVYLGGTLVLLASALFIVQKKVGRKTH